MVEIEVIQLYDQNTELVFEAVGGSREVTIRGEEKLIRYLLSRGCRNCRAGILFAGYRHNVFGETVDQVVCSKKKVRKLPKCNIRPIWRV